MIFLRSLTPEVTAEKWTQFAPAERARICARVVLPLPGGPHKTSDRSSPAAVSSRSSLPVPSRCSCPTNSSKVCGRMRSANGCTGPARLDESNSNRSMISCYHITTARVEQVNPCVGGLEVVRHGAKIRERQASRSTKHAEDCAISRLLNIRKTQLQSAHKDRQSLYRGNQGQ